MKQYLDLLKTIKEKGTKKPAAREGMPGSLSLFGYQFRHDLSEGFPLLTTKKMFWKGVVAELLWFLRGDTNIKYLVDQGVNIWNEDAYQYYRKQYNIYKGTGMEKYMKDLSYDEYIALVKDPTKRDLEENRFLALGDCGFQYGRVWRKWEYDEGYGEVGYIDQIAKVLNSLKNTPESRRHIVTAIDPAHDEDLALYWCHAMFQFNCRPIDQLQRAKMYLDKNGYLEHVVYDMKYETIDNVSYGTPTFVDDFEEKMQEENIPKYYLDCQLYQRSADVVLGVPFNIASYALLTHIIAHMVNMVPGEFIHTFGDVHIYDNHMAAVDVQLDRSPTKLPTLALNGFTPWDEITKNLDFSLLTTKDFKLLEYYPMEAIKAELSTGLKK